MNIAPEPCPPRRGGAALGIALTAVLLGSCGSDLAPTRPARLHANLADTGGDLFMRYPDGERIECAVYEDGQIHGASEVRRALRRKLTADTAARLVDSPQLGTWRKRLRACRAAIANEAEARDIVGMLAALPFPAAHDDLVTRFLDRSSDRADALVTALTEKPDINPSPAVRARLLQALVREADVDDLSLSHFFGLGFFERSGEMVTAFATSKHAGPLTAATILTKVRAAEVPSDAFVAVAPKLADDRRFADTIAGGLKSLPSAPRSTLARALVDQRDVSRLLILRILDELRVIEPEYRPYLYAAAAQRIMHDESLHPAILEAVQRLPVRSRADALHRVLRHAPPALAARALRHLAALPYVSRADALSKIIAGAAFVHPPVAETQRRAVAAAAALERGDQIRVLQTIHEDSRTDAAVREDVRVRLTVLKPPS